MSDDHIETLYKVELPLTPVEEGFGYFGVVRWNSETDKIQCHICGEWFKFLLSHVRQKHGVDSVEYRRRFGLSMRVPLVSRGLSAIYRAREKERWSKGEKPPGKKGKWSKDRRRSHSRSCKYGRHNALYLNKRGVCEEQLKRRLLVVADTLGKMDFTNGELKKEDPVAYVAIRKRYRGGLNGFRKKVGWGTFRERCLHDEESLIAAMRRKADKLGRIPRERDFLKGRPKIGEFARVFGSWNRALSVSLGLDLKPYDKPAFNR